MATEDKETPAIVEQESKSKRFVTVSFKCTPEEKSRLIKEAKDDSGLTVTDYIKHRVFNPLKPDKDNFSADNTFQEEKDALEHKLSKQKGLIESLKEELENLKELEHNDSTLFNEMQEDESINEFNSWLQSEEGKDSIVKVADLVMASNGNIPTEELTKEEMIKMCVSYCQYHLQESPFWGHKGFADFVEIYLAEQEEEEV